MKHLPWALVLTAMLGCAGGQRGGLHAATDWVQLTSEHFTVSTDGSPQNAKRIATYLEQLRSALLAAAWPHAKVPRKDHVEVVVMGDDVAFEQLFGRSIDAIFIGSGRESLLVLHGNPEHWEQRTTLAAEGSTSVLKHELVHRLAAALDLRQPRWLAEGLAQFLETIQLSPDGRSAEIGMVNLPALQAYKTFRTVGVKDALTWAGALDRYDEAATAARYGISWALVHWLFNAHPQAFARYQTAILEGASATGAWAIAFPNLSPEQADLELYQYISHGDYQVFTVPIPPVAPVAPRLRPMPSADVHALRAQLDFAAAAAISQGREDRLKDGQAELATALREDPDNLAALKLAFDSADPTQRAELARRATAAHPDSADAWLMAGLSMGAADSPEQQRAYLKAAALAPEDPRPLERLAQLRVTHGKASEGLPYAMKAAQLAPSDPEVLDTLALAYAGVGRCEDAVAAETRAIGFLPEKAPPPLTEALRERLQKLRTTCAPPAQ